MNTYVKIILILAGLAYLISPFDLIPDLFIPYLGWIDDTFIIAAIIYLLKFGRLPNFLRKKGPKQSFKSGNTGFKTNSGSYTRSDFFSGNRYAGRESGAGQSSDASGNRRTDEEKREKDPYVILGVSRNATKEEIQAAYKKKVKQYHPDRVSHLGEELQRLANQKFVEIKEAYDTLIKRV